jgi:DNA-binding LacI/PurR family transcriptional regulator
MASLKDVAERAGVSIATASRVATGSTYVRPETRDRVELAMQDLLYVAPGRTTDSGAIGLLLPEFGNPVFAALAQSLEAYATDAGYVAILCNTQGSVAREASYVHMLIERRVEGMVFICAEATDIRGDHAHYIQLLERGARLVFVNGGFESPSSTIVGIDERASGRLATEHLIELGHRRIGFVAGESFSQATREKLTGHDDALYAAGLEPTGAVAHAPFTVDGGREAFRALMDKGEGIRPTGVICSNDLMAIGAMLEASACGLHVPTDISIVGFDGIEAGAWVQPALTTIEQPIDDIAETAIAALRKLIESPEQSQPNYVFRPRLRPGGTTAAPPS